MINNNLTINGPGASLLTIRAFAGTAAVGDGARIFNVDDGDLATFKDVSISGLTLTGGDPSGSNGGAIRNRHREFDDFRLHDQRQHGCSPAAALRTAVPRPSDGQRQHDQRQHGHAAVAAGSIAVGGSLTVSQSTISGNTALVGSGAGGGIYSFVHTDDDRFQHDLGQLGRTGGGVLHTGVGILMTITNSTISGNSARVNGGGVAAVYGDVTVRHSTITLNRADSDNNGTGNGGGVFVDCGSSAT